jgi:hypothetical protein
VASQKLGIYSTIFDMLSIGLLKYNYYFYWHFS